MDSYVIFICQHDKFKQGNPVYHVDRIIRETGEVFDDGAHIIYVNGKYRGEDDLGKLAHDFNCKKADNIYYKPLADGVRHFKETVKYNNYRIFCMRQSLFLRVSSHLPERLYISLN